MKHALRLFIASVIITLLCSWGYFAHERINRLAVYTLPKGMLAFYRAYTDTLVHRATTADKRRYVDSSEIPRHFFNADCYGKNPFKLMPRKWRDFEKRYTRDTMLKNGILPWTIQQNYYWLVEAFKKHDTLSILRTSANLAHYIADAHVPLHLTKNHDGQLTGQDGLHALWESRLPELFGHTYAFKYKKARYINNPLTEAWAICRESYARSDSVLRLQRILNAKIPLEKRFVIEQRGSRKVKVYSPEYCKAYHAMLKGMVRRRMQAAIQSAGDFWFSAWVDAGQPDLNKMMVKK